MALERLFPSFKQDRPRDAYDPSDPESYRQLVLALIDDSRDFERILAEDRDEATKYYNALLPALNADGSPWSDTFRVDDPNATFGDILGKSETPNKSTYVSTDVRDAILMMMPALIRIFASSENVVALVPRGPADVDMAEQATAYINYCFWCDNPGFLILHGAFKDAMTVKAGYVKWWTDDQRTMKRKSFIGVTQEQLQALLAEDPTARIIQHKPPDPITGALSVTIESVESKPLIRVAGVPPEEIRLDRYARTFAKSRIVGHERIVTIDELTSMGYPRELCLNYIQSQHINDFTMEAIIRNPGREMSTRTGDGVLYGEWYIRADSDGDGVSELHYITTMGEQHDIIEDEPANRIKIAMFSVDPIPHAIVGDSIATLTIPTQRIKTNMWRGVLDSLAESINPKSVVNELMTNMDDVMNDDLGAIIRTRGDPSAAVAYTTTPFAGQAAIPVLEMLDEALARRTGLSDAARGLDPKALQSSTLIGVEAVINGAQERIELVARVLAETGFKDLFIGLFNEICESPNVQRTLRINGNFVPYDTSTFDASMTCEVNPTLGKGTDAVRMMTLQGIKQDQANVFAQFGPQNPVVGVPEMLATITDMLALANIRNVGRYFKQPDPQILQAIQSQPKEPDAPTIAAKAQYEKVKSDSARALGDQQLKQQKLQADDQFRHEQLEQKRAYEQQKLDIEAAKAHMESPAADIAKVHLQHQGEMMKAAAQHQLDREQALADHQLGLQKAASAHALDLHKAELDHQADMAKVDADFAQGVINAPPRGGQEDGST